MKKTKIRILFFVTLLLMIFGTTAVFALEGLEEQPLILGESENNIPAQIDYNLLVKAEGYIKTFEGSASTTRAIDDNYGGMYYDNGEYVLLFKDISAVNFELEKGFRMDSCQYSLNELYIAQDAALTMENKFEGFLNTAIDIINNTLLVRSDAMDQAQTMSMLKNLGVDINMVRYEKLAGAFEPTASTNAGAGSRNITRGSNSSASAGVTGGRYIVQGHDVKIGDKFGTTGGTTMGSATCRCQPVINGREADASLVTCNSGHSFSNVVAELGGTYRTLLSGRTAPSVPGMAVYMSGLATTQQTGDYATGSVSYLNSTYSWSDRDGKTHNYVGVEATYRSLSGDSGGCVWIFTTAGPIWAGVQSYGGATWPSSGYASAPNVASSLGVSVQ